jgi:tetratricopeptide (TPR) repeat protein
VFLGKLSRGDQKRLAFQKGNRDAGLIDFFTSTAGKVIVVRSQGAQRGASSPRGEPGRWTRRFRRLLRKVFCVAASVAFGWGGGLQLQAQGSGLAARSEEARQDMEAGRYTAAIQIYRGLLRALPQNIGLTLDLGLALHSAGRYQEAVPQFEKVVRQEPDKAPVWLLLGLDDLRLKQPSRAQQALERVVQLEPENRKAHLELAECFMDLHRPAEAVTHFERVAELDPQDPRAWQGIGLAYVALSQATFKEVEKASGGKAYAKVLLAQSLMDRNQFHLAFELYREALADNPGLHAAYEGLATIYQKSGHADWATAEKAKEQHLPPVDCQRQPVECDFQAHRYREVLKKTAPSHSAEALYWRAMAFEQLAQRAFDHLRNLPPSPAAYSLMAEAYRILGRYDLAVVEWEKALKLAPNDAYVQEGLAKALWINRQYGDAKRWLEKIIVKNPEDPDLNFELGDSLLYSQDNAAKALPYLEKAVKGAPGDLAARAALGRAYMRLNEPEKAIPCFKASLSFGPQGTIYYQLAQAYERVGEHALAKQAMAQFEAISKAARARKRKDLAGMQILPP